MTGRSGLMIGANRVDIELRMVSWRFRAVVLVTVALGAAAIAVIAVARQSGREFGKFSGYMWDSGPVRSIGARWRVPAVVGGGDRAEAANWVGVQQDFTASAAFVQI